MELNILEIKDGILASIAELETINEEKLQAIKDIDKSSGDEAEKAEMERELAEHRSRIDENSLRVRMLKGALIRIQNDTFGDCVSCHNEIPTKRLMNRPEVIMCVDCAHVQEVKEKRYMRG